jgi:hypothetical protein
MVGKRRPAPRQYQGVMVSSTFTDLQEHRTALMEALRKEKLFAIGMEEYVPIPGDDVISSSLNMVREGSAYIGLISHRCGQVPECITRNPHSYSITRLEFEEAQHLNLPTLVFVMGDDHPVKKQDIETDAEKIKKLEAYRERAKAGRICIVFNSLEDFTSQAIHAVAGLRRHIEEETKSTAPRPKTAKITKSPRTAKPKTVSATKPDPIPIPPAFYAEPAYIGTHQFVGRQAELDVLSDWAVPADPHPVLLFDAIGGSGKSMLTWEWTTKHATQVRGDWAGCFWYSFYERGAIMADFCRRALAYITGKPLDDFRRMKTPELGELLLHHLQYHPWLLVLDGLERVLVAYHRYDAAQVPDEEANKPTDQIARRDPCTAIRPEDDDLLRALAAAAPSKVLITSRLVPRVLLNPASQPIPSVLRVPLPGLRAADAEALLRSCGVTGSSKAIQNYLKSHCDCHPLVTGVLAGLINNYFPDKGNFDVWAADPAGGGQLDLANLDLIQKRNHILNAALAALPKKSSQFLSTLALLSEAVDYPTLAALNPHLPCEPAEVEEPRKPEILPQWNQLSDANKKQRLREYQAALQRRKEYEQALKTRLQSPEFLAAPQELANTILDLERRGLLQYDGQTRRYDLHPVVRGVAAGGLRPEERDRYGQRVVDHFSQQAHSPYKEAETLEDVRNGLHVVRTLLKMGRYQQAYETYHSDLVITLFANLEAYAEILSLLRPFFPQGWTNPPNAVNESASPYLTNDAALALYYTDEPEEALGAYGPALLLGLKMADWAVLRGGLLNASSTLFSQNRLGKEERCLLLALDLAVLTDDKEHLFRIRLARFEQLSCIGQWMAAEAMWQSLDPMGRDWSRFTYRPGDAEGHYAKFRFLKGDLKEEHLARAEQLSKAGRNRFAIRTLHRLRGEWWLEQEQWALAAESLHEAVRMARAVGKTDAAAETQLALAKFHLGQIADPRREAEQLANAGQPSHRHLADLWLAISDHEQAKKHALAAYKWAWADGEPYVHRYELKKARALLEKLGAEIPKLPRYDPAKDEKLPWEDKVAAAIERLRAEKSGGKTGKRRERE